MVRRDLESKVEKGSEGGLRWVEVSNDNPSSVVVSAEGEGTEGKEGIQKNADSENGVVDYVT